MTVIKDEWVLEKPSTPLEIGPFSKISFSLLDNQIRLGHLQVLHGISTYYKVQDQELNLLSNL